MGRLFYRGLSENGVDPTYSKLHAKLPSLTHILVTSAHATSSSFSAQFASISAFHVNRSNKWLLWHHRLGHPSDNVLHTTISTIEHSNVFKCTSTFVSHCKHCFSSGSSNSSWPTARPRNLAVHQANGWPNFLLLRLMGSLLAQWVRPWASFYAHRHPVGWPSNPACCPNSLPSPIT